MLEGIAVGVVLLAIGGLSKWLFSEGRAARWYDVRKQRFKEWRCRDHDWHDVDEPGTNVTWSINATEYCVKCGAFR